MPIIAVNVAPTVFTDIRALVDRGLYASPEQFLEIAAFNQLALERGVAPADVETKSGKASKQASSESAGRAEQAATRKSPAKTVPPASPKASPRRKKRSAEGRPGPVAKGAPSDRDVSEQALQDVLRRLSAGPLRSFEVLPTVRSTPRPTEERLWGQINRLFPLKFACRWVAMCAAENSQWQKYDTIAERMGEDAATIGTVLEHLDAKAGRKREEVLATGLPRQGNLSSRDRFLSQFVARTTRAAEIYPGAVCQYALAAFEGDRLVLTELGLRLSEMRNPILDDDIKSADSTLSADERLFFVQQVRNVVPGERIDFAKVLRAIRAGSKTPDALFESVRAELPSEWTEVMARTHLSGLIARMAEMSVLRRRWEGRKVEYETLDASSLVEVEGVGQ